MRGGPGRGSTAQSSMATAVARRRQDIAFVV